MKRNRPAKRRHVADRLSAKARTGRNSPKPPAHSIRTRMPRALATFLAILAISLATLGAALAFPIRGGLTHVYPAIHPSATPQAKPAPSPQSRIAAQAAPRASSANPISADLRGRALTAHQTRDSRADLLSTDNQDIGFTGYVKDAESGLYYAKSRYYDPRIGRFITQDPVEGSPMQPPSLHRYLYAYANPTVYVDPTGREVWDERIALLNATIAESDPAKRAALERQYYIAETRFNARVAASFEEARDTGIGLYQLGKNILKAGYEASLVGYATGAGTEGIDALGSGGRRLVNKVVHPIDNIYTPIHNQYVLAKKLDDQGQTFQAEFLQQKATIATENTLLAVASLPSAAKSLAGGFGNVLRKTGAADAKIVVEGAGGDVAAVPLNQLSSTAPAALNALPEGVEPYQLKLFPEEAYSRRRHYGDTPTPEQRSSVPEGMEFDHDPVLVRHYYDGLGDGSLPGFNMTESERKTLAADPNSGNAATPAAQRRQGAEAAKYSKEQKRKYGLDQ